MRIAIVFIGILALLPMVHADEAKPLPPIKPIPRLLPPAGVEIPKEERAKLEARLAATIKLIQEAKLDEALKPDVEIYTKAVRWALDFDEFYDAKKDVAKAHAALDSAHKRLDELKQGKSSWTTQRGLLARGYRSDIDDSVQPYGLHIPANLDLSKPAPLLVWLHGRGDKETDLHFIATREKNKGEFAPDWCITLHPYGRGTIGFKFAGEIDVLDAIESVKKRYKIDDDRIALAGFSMGGAGAWHIGAHYADRFCVVHAGAGFVETAKYNKLTPDKYPSWYEQKLWGWYDVPNYTRNLFNVPVIAYSGEKDKQIQAAREMEAAFKAEGRELNHIIGPGFEHKYEPKAKEEILEQIKAAVDKGREKQPNEFKIQTRTTRYGRAWAVRIVALDNAWEDARLDVQLVSPSGSSGRISTKNVKRFVLLTYFPTSGDILHNWWISVDGQKELSGGFGSVFEKTEGTWRIVKEPSLAEYGFAALRPIDDAYMSPFILVSPTGRCSHPAVQRWMEFEIEHFRARWRALFRGDVRTINDKDVTLEHASRYNLILFGDPAANRYLAKVADRLPLGWKDNQINVGSEQYSAASHIPLLIAPNPLQPIPDPSKRSLHFMMMGARYIVLNSGPTFREGHDRTNSQQTPKLPDWAIIGLDKDPDAFAPGEIKAAGFFDENWKVKAEEQK